MVAKRKSTSNGVVRRVWTPTRYEVNIGDGEYVIEPQPIERVMEFDTVARQIQENITTLGTSYWVIDGEGNELQGPFDEEAMANEFVEEGTSELDVRAPGFQEIVGAILDAPYPALRVLIPDLDEGDVRKSSIPNLKFVLELLVEVNGVEWFEEFVKNSIGPLLPELVTLMTEAAKASLQDSTETLAAQPGATD